jgi:hypothetical protein
METWEEAPPVKAARNGGESGIHGKKTNNLQGPHTNRTIKCRA